MSIGRIVLFLVALVIAGALAWKGVISGDAWLTLALGLLLPSPLEGKRLDPGDPGGAGARLGVAPTLAVPVACALVLLGSCSGRVEWEPLGVATDHISMTPQASSPVPSGKVGAYAKSSDGLMHFVGTDAVERVAGEAWQLRRSAGAPADAAESKIWYDDTAHALVYRNDTTNVTVATSGAAPAAHAASHLPGGSDALTTGAPSNVGTANATGSAAAFARQDHVHALPYSVLQTVFGGASGSLPMNSQKITGLAQGTGSGEALHAGRAVNTTAPLTGGGALTGDLTIALSPASASAAGSMSQADFIKLRDLAAAVFACTATQTTDATQTTAGTYTPADGKVVEVVVRVSGRKSDGSQAGGYLLAAAFRRAGATTTQVGATTALATHEDAAGWDATLDASGTDVRVRVTGAGATTIDWLCNGAATVAP